MENQTDKCYFCGAPSQYNFHMKTPVCSIHWEQLYRIRVPDYVDDSQQLQFKKLALEKRIWKI